MKYLFTTKLSFDILGSMSSAGYFMNILMGVCTRKLAIVGGAIRKPA